MIERLLPLLLFPNLLGQLPSSNALGANQKISYFARPAVVRILVACSGTYYYDSTPDNEPGNDLDYPYATGELGTGFFVDPSGYIVTNSHIVEPARGGREACEKLLFRNFVESLTGQSDPSRVDEKELKTIEANSRLEDFKYKDYVILPNGDSFPFRIVQADEASRSNVAVVKIEVKNAPILKFVADSDSVELVDPVMAIGYPIAADSYEQTLRLWLEDDTKALADASITNSQISSKDYRVAISSESQSGGIEALQLDNLLLTDPGSTGSPVLNQTGDVIGMVTDFQQGVGVPLVIPRNTIIDFVQQSGAENEESQAGRDYREGLARLWSKDYLGANAKFQAVKTLFPQHSEIDELIADTTLKISQVQDEKTYTPWLIAIGAVSVTLLGAYFLLKSRSKQQLVPSTAYLDLDPVAENPLQTPQKHTLPRAAKPAPLADTVAVTRPSLLLRNRHGQMRQYSLQKERHYLGRDYDWADLSVPEEGWGVVGRKHANLQQEADSYRLYDGDGSHPSTNGTFVRGQQITVDVGYLLQDGDEIEIGEDPDNQVTLIYRNPKNRRSSGATTQ